MSVGSVLVRSFQSWLRSSAAQPVITHAEQKFAPQIAKVVGDDLALSAKAVGEAVTARVPTGAMPVAAVRAATSGAARPVAQGVTRAAQAAPAVSKQAVQELSEAAAKMSGKPVMSRGEQLLASRRVALNRIHGDRRELIVQRFLAQKYPAARGYTVHPEQYLRDSAGAIARTVEGQQGRRIDFVVFKGDKAVSTVEVTSREASKAAQRLKEIRIREAGGRYLINPDTGKLVKLPKNQTTDILRLD